MIMKDDNGYMKSAMLIGDPGLGAFQESHKISVGVLLLDPDSEYPNHCHFEEEVYQARLPDGDSYILRLYVFGPLGLKNYMYGPTTLTCKI